jgi:hypothetical protein
MSFFEGVPAHVGLVIGLIMTVWAIICYQSRVFRWDIVELAIAFVVFVVTAAAVTARSGLDSGVACAVCSIAAVLLGGSAREGVEWTRRVIRKSRARPPTMVDFRIS